MEKLSQDISYDQVIDIAKKLVAEDTHLNKDSVTKSVLETGFLPNGQPIGDIGDFLSERKDALSGMPDTDSREWQRKVHEALGTASVTWPERDE